MATPAVVTGNGGPVIEVDFSDGTSAAGGPNGFFVHITTDSNEEEEVANASKKKKAEEEEEGVVPRVFADFSGHRSIARPNGRQCVTALIQHYMQAAGTENAARAHEAVYEAGRWMSAQLGEAPPAPPERFEGSGKIKKACLDKLWLRVAGLTETRATPAGPNAYVNACLEAEEAGGGDRFGDLNDFIVCAPGIDYCGQLGLAGVRGAQKAICEFFPAVVRRALDAEA